ncbi:phosphonate metabolism transcriptional regulator PhnF [Herbaspirillum lusitanum]|uniref:Phosphonate metabolism transcriptional regulator PhnF n=1 Tax=Herbaspirillum lusitanum TaxID=213312 RepID=A0ABW9AE72_9BURK
MSSRATRPSGATLWSLIETSLQDDILKGKLRGRLPNEQALAERFQVNRHTVRQAVQSLQNRGLVRVEHGRGTFVRDEMIDYRLGRSSRFSHSLAAQHLLSDVDLRSWEELPAGADVAQLLEIEPGAPVLKVELLDLADEHVVSVCTQYFPLPRFAGFIDLYRESRSTAEAFARLGILRFARKMSRISARLPRAEVARDLQQAKSLPVLYVESVYADDEGVPIEYGITRFAGDSVQVVVEPEA